MKTENFYEFLGDNDNGLGYVRGNEYNLTIIYRRLWARILGVFFGAPFRWKIIVYAPIWCPYDSWEEFYKNWEYKRMRISG